MFSYEKGIILEGGGWNGYRGIRSQQVKAVFGLEGAAGSSAREWRGYVLLWWEVRGVRILNCSTWNIIKYPEPVILGSAHF